MEENPEDIQASVSDREAEEYVRQFSPDNQIEDLNQEIHKADQDDNEEDDSRVREYLIGFIYDQNSQPKKKDIICYYDVQEENFVKVRIISKSNYRYYYNINFMEIGRPNAGIYLRPNDFWSHSLPVPREPAQTHLADVGVHQEQDDNLLPPIEQERQGRSQPSSHRQISLVLS